MSNFLNLKYILSYLGLFPYFVIIFDNFYFHYFELNILNDFLIYYSLIIITFIGATNWDLEENLSIFKIIYGFIPSLFAAIIIFLNLYYYNKVYIFFILILAFILQLFFDYLYIYKSYKNIAIFYYLRLPLTFIITIIFLLKLFL